MNSCKRTGYFRLHLGFAVCAGCISLIFAGLGGAAGAVEGEGPCTYYVDSETGQDEADGRSEERAWRSLERVNSAELKAGDTVRFKRGGVWRGSLEPVSGDESAPVTYTSYGEGAKPLLLGSVARNRPEDWVNIEGDVWATLPVEYTVGEPLADLRQSAWGRHQEAGANVKVDTEESGEGRTIRYTCENSGTASNHVQVWGPAVAVKKGAFVSMSFRARSTIPFAMPEMALQQNRPPWPVFASAHVEGGEIGAEWRDFDVRFVASGSSEAACIHVSLGKVLPSGAVFEFQPLALHAVTVNIADPLSVDVGNIIFDDGKVCGWKKWSVEDLKNPYDYYYDGASQRVYLCCPGNPAAVHKSIECALKRHVVHQGGARHVVYDGLAIKYGAAHGFGGGGVHHVSILNCDLGYIGGGHQLTREDGHPVRFGNAIEFWGSASNNLVEGCRIWEVYDAALTNQNHGGSITQENIVYRNNVVWNCEYSFEYWNTPETSTTKNIRFVNNTCVNAGVVWSHAQRPDQNGSHLMFYRNTAVTSGLEIKHNIFCNATDWGSRYTGGWETLPDMNENLWFTTTGVMVYFFAERVKEFEEYREKTGLDAQSVFAEPQFVDPAHGDFRLAPGSPARTIRADGQPVGAESLW